MEAVDDLDDRLDELTRAERARRRAEAALGDVSEAEARTLEDALATAASLLDGYEDRATGSGDFGGYLEFRQRFDDLVDGLADDLPRRGAFEEAQEAVDHRRLSQSHFEAAREALAPVEAVVAALDDLRSARDDLRDARRSLEEARRTLTERRSALEGLAALDPTALDAPVAALRDPVDRFNDLVREAHGRFLEGTPVREVLETYGRLRHFPLLAVEPPPADLVDELEAHPVGAEPLPTLLEYLSYSRSKLGHYVDDPGHLLGEVKPHTPYLEGLSAAPFTIDWPPPPADEFRWLLRERRQAVDRFADEAAIAALRELESLSREPDRYGRLRSGAVLREELDPTERDLVVSGEVEDELAAVDDALARIEAALEGDTG